MSCGQSPDPKKDSVELEKVPKRATEMFTTLIPRSGSGTVAQEELCTTVLFKLEGAIILSQSR